MLVQFGNNWIQKIPRTAKLDEAVIWQSSEFFSSNYFQIGQHVVLLVEDKLSSFEIQSHNNIKFRLSDRLPRRPRRIIILVGARESQKAG